MNNSNVERIMILGSTGMAGHVITNFFLSLKKHQIFNVSRINLDENTYIIDVENKEDLINLIKKIKPSIIINCIGLLVKESDLHPDRAIYINSYLPHFLEIKGNELNFKLIHLSTDCVFSGDRGDYSENDIKDGRGYYAQTKALGEIINNKDLTIRTSIIGPEIKQNGTGLFHWFLTQNGEIKGFTNVFWNGITTLELAKAMDAAIAQKLTGLYQLTFPKKISKFELLEFIKDVWHYNIKIVPDSTMKQDKSLVNHRIDFNFNVKDYSTMLKELHDWMKNYSYNHYHL